MLRPFAFIAAAFIYAAVATPFLSVAAAIVA